MNTMEEALYWYHGFGLLWTCALVEGVWYCALVGAVSHWYWQTPHHTCSDTGKQLDTHKAQGWDLIPHNVGKVIRYHIGSVCVGAGEEERSEQATNVDSITHRGQRRRNVFPLAIGRVASRP